MPKLPRLKGADAIRALERLGFSQIRKRGSHVAMKRMGPEGTRGRVVPLHDQLVVGTLRGILKQAGITTEDFIEKL